ncbi:MAG: tetratricopeptide repeat protein, partial [Verrucomicrobia bacterium]|nr:tetratricopeptide repeat protein [Verrucomicrobiota bacterium]
GLRAEPAEERVELYYGIAEGNYLIGDLRGAERGIEQMLRIAPDHVPALTLYARVRLDQKRPAEALESVERAIELEPDKTEHQLLKALVLTEKARNAMQSGESKAAIAAIDQAIAVYQNQSGQEALQRGTELRLMRARLLAQFGQTEAAITDLQTLTGQQPKNFEALITLASIYASVDRWGSLEALIPAIAARPELRDVALYLEGRSALAKNRVGTARAKFEAAIESLPEGADKLRQSLFFYRGVCLQKLDRQDEAQASILDAIDAGFRPETSEEAIIASRTLLRNKRAEDAIPLLEAITLNRIAPDAEVWAMLGRAHLADDTPALALSALNEALQIDPKAPEPRALRGSLLRKIGDLDGALADYETAQSLQPENPAIAYARGLVHLQLGQVIQADQAIGQAAAALPGQPGLQLLHALLALTLEEHKSARSALHRYQKQVSESANPTAHYLDYLLNGAAPETGPRDAIRQYFSGTQTLKETLDDAGRADTPEQARKQITATAFWMAQFERAQGSPEQAEKLLEIAVDVGNPDLTEYQLAKWQLAHIRQ